ncbi:16S rRNA (guanine(966)-N(2))-methyltransferase RsmD [Candidatus Pelagibacter sp.]|nr:16S rRNA (guanine(966)-N(2))-methyltransferase RsmD [Candidatus Pelagibacter sp.]
MRIISGNSKGKKIIQPKDRSTRPLKDLTKESIFNIIKHSNKLNIEIEKAHILDLFSGVGSFGLECLSRGALSATFVENYKEASSVLNKNIGNLKFFDYSSVIEKDVFNELDFRRLKKFNIIFIDPPYKEQRLNKLLQKIDDADILDEKGIIIIHRHKKEKEKFIDKLKILEIKTYGISKITFGAYI